MATIQDIANQINNTLTQINLNTQDTANTLGLVKGDTADIKSRMDTLIGVNQAGFEQLGQGMFLMLEQLRLANSLLAGQVRQQDAMLCWFANLADLLCRILQRENSQVELQTLMEADVDKLRKLFEIAYPAASGEVDRFAELDAKLRACCGPRGEPQEPCPPACERPTIDPYDPQDNPNWGVPPNPVG